MRAAACAAPWKCAPACSPWPCRIAFRSVGGASCRSLRRTCGRSSDLWPTSFPWPEHCTGGALARRACPGCQSPVLGRPIGNRSNHLAQNELRSRKTPLAAKSEMLYKRFTRQILFRAKEGSNNTTGNEAIRQGSRSPLYPVSTPSFLKLVAASRCLANDWPDILFATFVSFRLA